jgi:hypothetical protein
MATTTPNFGWAVPTSTDLVKDGAVAIETLGDSIDASLVDLKGGTTGQVLAKASNTDMDFSWVAQDDSNAIQNSIVDAKGDLIAATANDTPARLAVGTNGQVLTADSTAATGLAWATASAGSTYVAGKNAIFNSAFDIWQRGTSSTGTAYNYTADRWLNFRGAFASGATFSRIASTQAGFQYALRAQRNSGNTATDVLHLRQALETNDSLRFQGQTVTLSFYARAGANFSPTSSILVSTIYQGEGTDQATDNMTGWTGVTAIAQNNTLTTSWQRFTQTTTISSAKTQFGIAFTYTPTGTAGAADNYDITGVQVEIASTASAFSRQTGSLAAELSACQRYYASSIPNGYTITDFPVIGTGTPGIAFYATGSNDAFGSWQLPVEMRTTPTTNIYSSSNRTSGSVRSATTGTDYTCSGFGFSTGNRKGSIYLSGFGAGVTSGLVLTAQWTASAEL